MLTAKPGSAQRLERLDDESVIPDELGAFEAVVARRQRVPPRCAPRLSGELRPPFTVKDTVARLGVCSNALFVTYLTLTPYGSASRATATIRR